MKTHSGHPQQGNHLSLRRQVSYAPFVVGIIMCVAGFLAVYGFFVKSPDGQFIDESALVEAIVAKKYIGLQTAKLLDYLPVTSVFIAAFVVLFVTLARRRWKAAGIALAAMAAANLSTQLIKAWLPDRPQLGVSTLALNSLPSGHSTVAASAAAAVFLVVSPRWRPLTALVGGSYAVLAGLSTLINQWHRPSDVIAAFFIVAAWTLVAAPFILRSGKTWNVWLGSGQHWGSSKIWISVSALVALAAGVASALILNTVMEQPSSSSYGFFLAGVGQIVAVGYGLAAVSILLLTHQVKRR